MNHQLLLAASLFSLGLLSGCDNAEQRAAGDSEAAKPGVVQPSPAVGTETGNAANTAADVQETENQTLPAEGEVADPDETAGGIYSEDEDLAEEGAVEEAPVDEGIVEEGIVDEGAVDEGAVTENEAVADEEEAPVDNTAPAQPKTE